MPFLAHDVDTDEEDYEAKDAMMSLFRAEEIKDKSPDFLSRVSEQIDLKIDLLERVRGQLPKVLNIVSIDISENTGDPSEGSRRFEDFLARIRNKEAKEEAAMFENPTAKRAMRKLKQSRR